jgi:nicotinate-nucleotide pyrophosphorylase (carboxylating)
MVRSADDAVHRDVLRQYLEEDIGTADITTLAIVPADRSATGHFVAKAPLVLAGVEIAVQVFALLDEAIDVEFLHRDGDLVSTGRPLARLRGRARALLTGERVATNLLQRLSGIATLTRRFVDAVRGTGASILDTRKTTPGLRTFEKYAVRVGGGLNHRMRLDEAILIKDNHIRIAGSVRAAVEACRSAAPPGMRVEVEVTTLPELEEALRAGVDAVLLDNMSTQMVETAVRRVRAASPDRRVLVEVSGGITLQNVRQFAAAGPDWISIGALTHSAPAVDMSFEIDAV